MNKLNSFFSIFFIFFFLIFFSYIFVVIFIDPYDIFHQTKFEKINNKKYFHLEREYVHKEINLLRNNPNILLLGSSSSLIGFELHNYKNFKNKKVYNFGLSGVGPYEMNLYMSELIDNLDNLEKVIIGLDFFMFHNERVIRPQFYEFDYTNKFMNVFKLGRIILTKSCAKDTFLTLYKNMTDKTVSNEITFYGNLKSDLVYNSLLSKYGSNEEIFINFLKSDFNDSKNSLQNYNISDKELQNLDKLIKLLEENNINKFDTVNVDKFNETFEIFDRNLFNCMKKEAYFINVGRGKTVNENHLYEALRKKIFAGGALDVFYDEPLNKNSNLLKLKNLIITPHIAGLHNKYWQKESMLFERNLDRFLMSKKLINQLV